LAKYPKSEMEPGDRICMLKWSPIKEGTVTMFDEEEANILFDDGTKEWVHLGYFYITRKNEDIVLKDGQTWREFANRGGSQNGQ
jgi:hypothetical protein